MFPHSDNYSFRGDMLINAMKINYTFEVTAKVDNEI